MLYQTLNQSQQSTCQTCPKFKDYNESNGRGWCQAFDRSARKHHSLTQDCVQQIESEQLQELLSSNKAFTKPISKVLPGVNVFKQSPEYGYERIGYVSENLVGWFALDHALRAVLSLLDMVSLSLNNSQVN